MTKYTLALIFSLICILLTPFATRAATVPAGTALCVRTLDQVSLSDKAGKKFFARLDSNFVAKGTVVAPAGTKVMAVSSHPGRRGGRLGSRSLP